MFEKKDLNKLFWLKLKIREFFINFGKRNQDKIVIVMKAECMRGYEYYVEDHWKLNAYKELISYTSELRKQD